VVLLVCTGFGLRSYYFLHDKEAWDQVAAFIDRSEQRGDAIVFSVGFLHIPFDHYYTAPAAYSVREVDQLNGDAGDVFVALGATKTSRRVWLIVSHPNATTDAVITSFEGVGRLTAVAQFTEVDVYLYEIGPE
jgi:hypothetical protein